MSCVTGGPHDLRPHADRSGAVVLKCSRCPYTQAEGGNGKRIKPKPPKGGGKR